MKLLAESKEKNPRSSMNDTSKASKWLQNSILGLLDASSENTDLTDEQISKSLLDIYLKFCEKSGIQPYRKFEHHGCDSIE
jgi:predicted HicB family RNase H-like nuclease